MSESDMTRMYYDTNRRNWNERTPIHARSLSYDLDGFRAGRNSLLPIERVEVGEVNGKSLLHLQCHLGTDTLSWAQLGALVTGVDFSEEALTVARSLNIDLALNARFLQSNIYDLPKVLDAQFDIVYTSYGVLCWLHDIPRWAQIAAQYVKPGGTFYLAEFHPLAVAICDGGVDGDTFRMTFPYFSQNEPCYCAPGYTYTDGEEQTQTGAYEWSYTIGQVTTALIDAGLQIEFLHEHPCCAFPILPEMQEDADGLWWRQQHDFPLMFSLRARKENESSE